MSTESMGRTGAFSFLRRRDCPNFVVCCVSLALAATLIGLQVTLAVASSGALTEGKVQTRKGDRLPLFLSSERNQPRKTQTPDTSIEMHQLLDGCESVASNLVTGRMSPRVGRCIS